MEKKGQNEQIRKQFPVIESLYINPNIMYQDYGIFANKDISKSEVIFRIKNKDVICFSNIPKQFKLFFKEKQKSLQSTNKAKGKSSKDLKKIKKNSLNMDQQQIVLLLYLVYLTLIDKNMQKYQNCEKLKQEDMVKQLKIKFHSKQFNLWLRNSSSTGFAGFPNESIHKTGDQNLIIEYHAYKNTIFEFSQQLASFIKQLIKGVIQQELQIQKQLSVKQNQNKQNLLLYVTTFDSASETELKDLIFQCIQLKNTRSFGYTKETMIIPYFDFLNHSSSQNIQLKISKNQEKSETLQLTKQSNQKQVVQPNQDDESSFSCDSSDDDQLQLPQHIQIQLQTVNNKTAQQAQNRQFMIQMVCIRQTKKGQQMYLNYGSRNNEYLLKWYGFIEQNNPYDRIKIYYDLYKDKIYSDKIQRSTQQVVFRYNYSMKNQKHSQIISNLIALQKENQIKKDNNYLLTIDNLKLIQWLQNLQQQFQKYRCGAKSSKSIMKLIYLTKQYNQKTFYSSTSKNFNKKLIYSIPVDIEFQNYVFNDLFKRVSKQQNMPFEYLSKDVLDKVSTCQKWLQLYHLQQKAIYVHHVKIINLLKQIVKVLYMRYTFQLKNKSSQEKNEIQTNPDQNLLCDQKHKYKEVIRKKLQQCVPDKMQEIRQYLYLLIKNM